MSNWEHRRTRHSVEAHDRYVRSADRDRWLVEHPGVPLPPSMLTAAEHRAELHVRQVHDATWKQMRTRLIVKWVLVALTAIFLGAGVGGFLIFAGSVIAMAVHHRRERALWHDLHRSIAAPPPPLLPADEAERIVAEWQPPTVHGPAVA